MAGLGLLVRFRIFAQGGNAEMDRISRQALLVFNEAMKRVDEVYRSAVKQYGMSEP